MVKSILLSALLISVIQHGYGQRYIFYLHGKIVEDQGANAVDNSRGFGAYEYANIIAAFRKEKFSVISECRPKNTDVKQYAHKVAGQVDSLLKSGIKPGDVTVIGASKGALIAMYAATYVKNELVNYVFMSSCNDYSLDSNPDISFCGNTLSIFEKSDEIGLSCERYRQRSKLPVPHYKEIELNTGKKHGYIYKPLPEWVTPSIKWANGNYK